MAPGIDSGLILFATAQNATSAVATLTGVAGKKIYITDISGSSDKAAAQILVKDGTTVVWQDIIRNTVPYTKDFIMPIPATVGNNVSVTVDGTADCRANILGYIV